MILSICILFINISYSYAKDTKTYTQDIVKLSDNTIKYNLNGKDYIYTINDQNDKNVVTLKDINGKVLTTFTYVKNTKTIHLSTENKDIKVDKLLIKSKTSSEQDYKVGSVSIPYSDLITGGSMVITVATLTGLLLAAAGGTVIVSTTILEAILSKVLDLIKDVGSHALSKHGITFNYKLYKSYICRGSNGCGYVYDKLEITNYSTY